MASIIFNSLLRDMATGAVDFDTDTFYMSLHSSTLTPNKDTMDRFDDVTNENTGTGYTAGGQATAVTVAAVDTANDRVDISFAAVTWTTVTLTNARYGVIRKRRGGAASADELVCCIDFGSNQSPVAQDLVVTPSSPLRLQN